MLTIDARKAFDNVIWAWLDRALDRLGVLGPLRVYLSSLYNCPLARVYTPGYLSDIILLHKKAHTRAVPLSPLLFNLALEPLSRYFVERAELRGIAVGDVKLKLAQFANDLLFLLSHPSEDLLCLTIYGQSGYARASKLMSPNLNY